MGLKAKIRILYVKFRHKKFPKSPEEAKSTKKQRQASKKQIEKQIKEDAKKPARREQISLKHKRPSHLGRTLA